MAVLVIGATGNQGGATARHLLDLGVAVHAFVRDPDAPAALRLRKQGATLVRGDLNDPDSLRTAMSGLAGVFSVQTLAYEPATLAVEVKQGKAVTDAAHEAGVSHLVYSSVGGAERETGIDHFESKAAIERHIETLGLPTTILRPVFFMDNLLHFADAAPERVLALPLRPDRPMQMIASDDIGRVAALAFAKPAEFVGERLELAGDALAFGAVADIYQRITGTPTRFEPQAIDERMFEWFAESGYQADIPGLRKRFPWLSTFEEFLRASVHSGPRGVRSEGV